MGIMDVEPIYCAEQIKVPPQLAEILKNYTKEVIRRQPEDLIQFSASYFATLAGGPSTNGTASAPTCSQISELYSAAQNAGNVRTCDLAYLQEQSLAAGIARETVDHVVEVAGFGATSAVDPAEYCLLLITMMSGDVHTMLTAMFDVFGRAGTIHVDELMDLFGTLGKYDTGRWGGEFVSQLRAQLGDASVVGYNSVAALPCIEALA